MKAKLLHKVVLVVTIPVLFQLTFFSVLFNSVKELDGIQQSQRETEKQLLLFNELRVTQALNGCYYTLLRTTLEKQYYDKLNQSMHRMFEIYQKLLDASKDDPVQTQSLKGQVKFQSFAARFLKMLLTQPKPQTLSEVFGGGMAISATKGNLLGTFTGGPDPRIARLERTRTRQMQQFQEKQIELKNILQLSIIASIIVSTLTGLIFSSSVIRRLQTVAANIRSMENHDELMEAIKGDDEIASLNMSVQETGKQIRQAEEFQAQTARIVAKELKDPIDQLSESLRELKDEGFESLTNDGTVRLERSLQEVERLRILTRDLLSLDKISRAGWDLEITGVNLAETAATAIDTVKEFASSVRVNITGDLSDVRVSGDASRLQQIALNLLTNAIKFSPRKRTIEVETKIEGSFGKLSVTDHGTGIPEDFQKSIFGKYEQATREDSTERGGSGLGLAISKKLIEAQQGRMGFNSKLGEGSTFWFMLPLHPEDSSSAALAPGAATDQEKTETALDDSYASTQAKSKAHDAPAVHPTLWLNGLVLVLLPLLLQLSTIGLLWIVVDQIEANVATFYKTGSLAVRYSAVLDAISVSCQCALYYNIEHDERLRSNAQEAQRVLADRIFEVQSASSGDKKAEKGAAKLEEDYKKIIQGENDIMDAPQNADLSDLLTNNRLMDLLGMFSKIALPVQQAVDEENRLIESNSLAKMEMQRRLETVIVASSICTLLGAIALGLFFTRQVAFRVGHVVRNTRNLIEKKELEEPLPGNDEIAYVDRSFYEAANRLIQLERFKQEIIAITSHEFRTPLTSLLAKVDLIQVGVFGTLNEKGKKIALAARSNISCLIVLITNLLDVEKIQSGRTIVAKEATSIDALFTKATQDVAELAADRQVTIEKQDTNITASADAPRLSQALGAVLRDILEHASKGSSVALSAQAQENTVSISLSAPGGDCSRYALNYDSARGRLAADLMKLIAEQHGGKCDIDAGSARLLINIEIPRL